LSKGDGKHLSNIEKKDIEKKYWPSKRKLCMEKSHQSGVGEPLQVDTIPGIRKRKINMVRTYEKNVRRKI
jgi:hypothetical protein